jgi:adenylate cyclase
MGQFFRGPTGGIVMDVPIPENDPERVVVLKSYEVLDTAPEAVYDDITELAAQICQCPIAFISFTDDKRGWFKSKYGLPAEFTEGPRASPCAITLCQNDISVVPDLTKDERYSGFPMVTGEPHFRFYCGMPLINPEGYALGTICVLHFQPMEIDAEQAETMRRLSRQIMSNLELRRKLIELKKSHEELDRARAEIESEKAKSEKLLLNILPERIVDELKEHGRVEPRYYHSVTIMFTDFVGFTRFVESMEPNSLIQQLNQCFSAFDEIAVRCNLKRLKTIGDSYMCVGGLPDENRTHLVDICLAALEIQEFMARVNRQHEKMRLSPWELRIGIHTGPVIAGVVGTEKFTYDVWGDAVNVASFMESNGVGGRINLSKSASHRIEDLFDIEHRGSVEGKGKGPLEMYFLNRIKPELSRDESGRIPNDKFKVTRERLNI